MSKTMICAMCGAPMTEDQGWHDFDFACDYCCNDCLHEALAYRAHAVCGDWEGETDEPNDADGYFNLVTADGTVIPLAIWTN